VVCVNWDDAKAFAAWLSKKADKPYRLLSEAEREYATRGRTTTRYYFGNDETKLCQYGNGADRTARNKTKIAGGADCEDGYAYTAPVGQFTANPFGLHDMHGNVYDWVEDCWHDSYKGAPTDGSAWITSCTDASRRVLRGGAWSYNSQALRSANRSGVSAGNRFSVSGFRLARTLNP
jgi:formylglycine-generating enzyme required for sulfatase activity